MIPIQLKGHTRPVTQLKFNSEGDLLFSSGRDRDVSVWFAKDGERLGTLGPHGGAVFTVDVDKKSRYAITGAADGMLSFWNIQNGKLISQLSYKATQRYVQLHPHGDQTKLLVVQDQQFGLDSTIRIFDLDMSDLDNPKITESLVIAQKDAKFNKAAWTYDGKRIIVVHTDGKVSRINAETGEVDLVKMVHKESIVDIQMSPDRTYFVTASRDSTASLLEVDGDFETDKRIFRGDVPLNSAAISPIKDTLIAGGGIDARNVTTSSGSKFEAHFFHKIFSDDLGRVDDHFGPINTIAIHPYGTSYASGSEDGYLLIHHFDKNYFDFEYPSQA